MNGDVTAAMNDLTVRVTSPDGRIAARLRNHRNTTIKFRPTWFAKYQPPQLETQLGDLLNALWSTYRSTVRRTLTAAGAKPVAGKDLWQADRRRFHGELEEQVVLGMSSRKCVGVRSVHTSEFEVRLRPGVLESIAEPQFVAEFNSALMNWEAERRRRLSELRNKHFEDESAMPVTIRSTHEEPDSKTGNRK